MIPDPSSQKPLSPRERAVRALGLTSRELLNLTSLGDLAAFTEQRVADAIADAEDAIAKPLETRLAQLEQEQATMAAIHKQELENCGAVTADTRTDACWMCPKCHALSVSGYDPCAACGYDSRTGAR